MGSEHLARIITVSTASSSHGFFHSASTISLPGIRKGRLEDPGFGKLGTQWRTVIRSHLVTKLIK